MAMLNYQRVPFKNPEAHNFLSRIGKALTLLIHIGTYQNLNPKIHHAMVYLMILLEIPWPSQGHKNGWVPNFRIYLINIIWLLILRVNWGFVQTLIVPTPARYLPSQLKTCSMRSERLPKRVPGYDSGKLGPDSRIKNRCFYHRTRAPTMSCFGILWGSNITVLVVRIVVDPPMGVSCLQHRQTNTVREC